jgi:NitT/TauT family transport system permease protein
MSTARLHRLEDPPLQEQELQRPHAIEPAPGLARLEDTLRAAPEPRSVPAAVSSRPPWARAALRLRQQAPDLLLALASLGSLLLFWHLATTYRWDFHVRFSNIPTPLDVLQRVPLVNEGGKFVTNVAVSLRRIFMGFAMAAVVGVALGLAIGRYPLLRKLVFPAMEALRPIPAIAWVPIAIMLWPSNEESIVFITFIGSFFPILINTMAGVQAVDAVLLRAGQCLGAREPQLLWHVVLPGALPQIFTGLAVGMGVAWVSLIAAEMISGQFGIGYFTWEAYSLISYADIVLGMITIGVLGLLSSELIRAVGRAVMPWRAFGRHAGALR